MSMHAADMIAGSDVMATGSWKADMDTGSCWPVVVDVSCMIARKIVAKKVWARAMSNDIQNQTLAIGEGTKNEE
jgi:hypothetical protein